MRIGILEIMPNGHYTLVDSLVRIYASDDNNKIFLCVPEEVQKILDPLKNVFYKHVLVHTWISKTTLKQYFYSINNMHLDALYIITIEKYFRDFHSFNFNCKIKIFIHNIDEWFGNNLSYSIYHLIKNLHNINSLIYRIKKNFLYSYYKRNIIKKVLAQNGKCVVLNSTLKQELMSYIPEKIIEVIPFSVFRSDLGNISNRDEVIRICIPGMVSELRRDYYSLIKILHENIDSYKNKLEVVLLGIISHKEYGNKIINKFKILIEAGLKVRYFNEYIPQEVYDNELAKADIILGNIITKIDRYSQYGKTKETGIPFAMIRAAKPGILPSDYPIMKEIESSTIRFTKIEELTQIFNELITNPQKLLALKEEAKKNSEKFSSLNIYRGLAAK